MRPTGANQNLVLADRFEPEKTSPDFKPAPLWLTHLIFPGLLRIAQNL
jgi:hypothetical protein